MARAGADLLVHCRERQNARAVPARLESLQAARRPAGRPARPRRRGPLGPLPRATKERFQLDWNRSRPQGGPPAVRRARAGADLSVRCRERQKSGSSSTGIAPGRKAARRPSGAPAQARTSRSAAASDKRAVPARLESLQAARRPAGRPARPRRRGPLGPLPRAKQMLEWVRSRRTRSSGAWRCRDRHGNKGETQ